MAPPPPPAAAAAAATRPRFVASALNWLRSRRQVGDDRAGNKFFEQYVAADKPNRRLVEYYDGADVNSVNILWWQWLNHLREAVPSPEEVARLEAQRASLKRKVQKLEAEDEKLRLRQYTSGELGDNDDVGGGAPGSAERAAATAMQSMIGGSGGGTGGGTSGSSRGRRNDGGAAGGGPPAGDTQSPDDAGRETAAAQSWSGGDGEVASGGGGSVRRRRR